MTPPEADPYAAFAQDGPLTRGDTAQLVAAALHLFPVNGYRSPFADVVGESPLGTAVQCAVQAGLLPARWAAVSFKPVVATVISNTFNTAEPWVPP